MDSRQAAVEAIAARTEQLRAEALRRLNEDLFGDDGSYRPVTPAPRPTWSQRLIRARDYAHTLWLALKGTELVKPSEDW